MEADLLIKVILPASLFVIMLGMGLALKPLDFKMLIVRPKAVALGVFAQMVLLPFMAYLIVTAFGLSGAVAVGVMILALCPGGPASNLYTVVSLLAPFTVPLMIVLFMGLLMGDGQQVELPVIKTIIQLVVITIVPICIGMFIHHKKPGFSAKAEQPVKTFSVLFLLFIVILIVVQNIDQMGAYFAQAGVAALVLNISCLVMGYAIAKFATKRNIGYCYRVNLVAKH